MTLNAPCYFFITLALCGGSVYGCNDNKSLLVDDMCIFYDPTRTTWFEAKKTCAQHGMHLATVQLPEQIVRIKAILPPNTQLDAWIGGNDIDNEGHFIWDEDGRPIVESVWRETEPNHYNGDDDCTFVNDTGLIDDIQCTSEKPALCMYRLQTPPNFFGPKNTYICHCAEGTCLSDGTCSGANVLCSKGWFGPKCQFRSLSGDKYGPLGVLADNDDTTCISNITQPITVKLKAGSFFTWIRIIVENSEHLGGFKLYFNAFGATLVCQGLRSVTVGERSVDIVCSEGPFILDDVILTWSGKKNVCSIYINGGQNFALLEDTSLGKVASTDKSSSLPVDGRRGPTDQCFTGLPRVGTQKWVMTFRRPKVINEIIVYRKPKVEGYAFMNYFYIRGSDGNGNMMFHYKDNGTNADQSTVSFITEISVPMNKIEIILGNANETHYLEICEVEAFGACGPPEYGLFCDQTCDARCGEHGCHLSGMCIACAYGQSEKGECLSAEEAAPAVMLNVTFTSTDTTSTLSTKVNRTTKMVTAVPLPLCTTTKHIAQENYRLVRYLLLGNVLLAQLVALLVVYIICTRNKISPSTVGSPVEEFDKMVDETAFLDDLEPVKSEHSRKADVSVHSFKIEKSNVTLKLTRSDSTHVS